MRIFLLPLTTRQALIYCQKPAQEAVKPLSIADRVTKFAAKTWANWETHNEGWRKTVVTYGNAGLKRVPYQEWGLKSFPPGTPRAEAETLTGGKRYDVFYPGNIVHEADVPKVLYRLAKERKILHWNRFVGSMFIMPLTAPFALVPVIPNIPFFYVAYRCWSHWRALKGSDHLEFILENRLYRPISTKQIEDLYETVAPDAPDFNFVTASQIAEKTAPEEKTILPTGSHTEISKVLEVPELSNEVERAVWQVNEAVRKEKEAASQGGVQDKQ